MTESRENEIKLRLNDAELERLDELRGGVPRAAFVRSLLRGDPQDPEVASRAEALSILTSLARDGRVSAAVALVRELPPEDGESFTMSLSGRSEVDEIDRLLVLATIEETQVAVGDSVERLDDEKASRGWRYGGCNRAIRLDGLRHKEERCPPRLS